MYRLSVLHATLAECTLNSARGNCKHNSHWNTRGRRSGAPAATGPGLRPLAPATPTSLGLTPPLPPSSTQLGFGCLQASKERRWAQLCAGANNRVRRRNHSAVPRATWRAGVRKPLGETVLSATLSIFLLRGATPGTMLKKFDKKDEESGERPLKGLGRPDPRGDLWDLPGLPSSGPLSEPDPRPRRGRRLVRRSIHSCSRREHTVCTR